MFEKLIGIAAGSFGRLLLTAGVVPATVMLLLVALYLVPAKSLVDAAGKLAQQEKVDPAKSDKDRARSPELSGPVVVSLLGLAALSGLMFACRHAWLRYLETIPFPAWFRNRRMAKEQQRRADLINAAETARFDLSSVAWINRKPDSKPKARPPGDKGQVEADLLRRSKAGLDALNRSANGRPDHGAILDGTRALFLLGVYEMKIPFDEQKEKWVEAKGRAVVKDRLENMETDLQRRFIEALQRSRQFPSDLWLKPTALGNKIESIEDYAESRYGVETSTLLNRVWWVLADGDRESIGTAKSSVESLANLMLAFLLAGVLIGVIGLYRTLSTVGVLEALTRAAPAAVFVAICSIFSLLCYKAAVAAVDNLRDCIVGLIDVYRLRALAKLGFVPKSFEDELVVHRELKDFWVQQTRLEASKNSYQPEKQSDKFEGGGPPARG